MEKGCLMVVRLEVVSATRESCGSKNVKRSQDLGVGGDQKRC